MRTCMECTRTIFQRFYEDIRQLLKELVFQYDMSNLVTVGTGPCTFGV